MVPVPLILSSTQPPPSAAMEDGDDDYLDSLRGGRSRLPSRGNPPGHSNYDLADQERQIGGARAFGTTAPDFASDIAHRPRPRPRTTHSDTLRFDTSSALPRLCYWNNSHVGNSMKEWGSLKGPFPVLAPTITEVVKIKHAIYDASTRMTTTTNGDWTDKTELSLSKFED